MTTTTRIEDARDLSTPTIGSGVDTVVRFDKVVKQYGSRHNRHTAVQETSLQFDNTTRVGVVGESGSGKSTVSRMMVGLEVPTSGDIVFESTVPGHTSVRGSVRSLLEKKESRMDFRRSVQFIGQDTTSSFDPRHRLIEAVTDPSMVLRGLSLTNARALAEETLDSLGLPSSLSKRYPTDVSGGQRQRFAIARALVVKPRILICDEVVSALDVSVQGSILNFLKDYCEENHAGLVFVSHGLPATAFVSSSLMVMYQGQVIETGSTDDVVDRPRHEYTRRLLGAYRGPQYAEAVA
jgi:ABC-type dipeptide/oligopeptide/nickel transport system ATPase subunit